MNNGPLSDIRILSVSEYGAGPLTTQLFADLGADVIKIENTTLGDSGRYVPPYQSGDDSLFFQSVNRGARSVAIDLKTPEGQEILGALAAKADAVFTNIRPRAAEKLGLTYESLKASNPGIVAFLLTGWGRNGPDSARPAYDYLVQAAGGQMDLNAEEGEKPRRSATPWVDTSTSYVSAFGLLTAIHHARRTGVGYDAESSMLNTAMTQWMYLSTWYLTHGYEPDRLADSSHPSIVPCQVFKLADGHVMVTCMTQQFWRNLCEALQVPGLADDPRFATFTDRRENKKELVELLNDAFEKFTRDDIRTALDGRVPMEIVRSFAEGLDEYRTKHPEAIVTVDHPEFGRIEMASAAISSQGWETHPTRGPRWGEHTRSVLLEAGLAEDVIGSYVDKGIVKVD
ncbi:CoA transferase [Mycolicibacterium sp. P9-64]|uniref:CaiB/BaiF CoA transferase family protein n=1 Tax=Mycolicibacterium sp. P9-64 TaxID=2024612 RepID=UPI0011EC9CEF|nr:CoA transferase [Mycolicibacterium sp. P9-64]KAA0085599.1 CoA transferase [Mycolicibacterium sp. P9-64]